VHWTQIHHYSPFNLTQNRWRRGGFENRRIERFYQFPAALAVPQVFFGFQ
jgi:hypothetical protein